MDFDAGKLLFQLGGEGEEDVTNNRVKSADVYDTGQVSGDGAKISGNVVKVILDAFGAVDKNAPCGGKKSAGWVAIDEVQTDFFLELFDLL